MPESPEVAEGLAFVQVAELVPLPTSDPQRSPRLTRLADLAEEARADAAALHQAKQSGRARGPVTNLRHLDEEIGSALLPGVHIVHGVPGAGKSAFALQIAATCACPALYVTLEMRPLVLLKRLAARVTSTYLGRFNTGELPPETACELYGEAAAASPYLAILDATSALVDASTILQAAETTRKLCPSNPHLLIVIDSLHSWADTLGDAPEYDRLNSALTAFRGIAAMLQCPVLAVAERNRAEMNRGGQSAGAGTRKIEYGAETVFDLDVKPEAAPDEYGRIPVTLKLPKNRNGQAGRRFDLSFNGRLQLFQEA